MRNIITLIVITVLTLSCGNVLNQGITNQDAAAAPDTVTPEFWGLISATPAGSVSIYLTWFAANDNRTIQSQMEYDIYMCEGSSCTPELSAPMATVKGKTMYMVEGLTSYTDYTFIVRARDEADNSDTNTLVRTAATAPTPSGLSRFNQVKFNQAYF